jgi:hypothetical protein
MDNCSQGLNTALFCGDLLQGRYSASDPETETGSGCLFNFDGIIFHFSA